MTSGEDGPKLRWDILSSFPGPHQSPGFKLWREFMDWQRLLNARLKPVDLTQPQFAILAVCAWLTRENQTITQQDVATFTGMDRMHISQIVSKLERGGLLERQRSTKDLRSKVMSLTAAGSDKLAHALPVVEKFDLEFFRASEADKLRG